MSDFLTRLIDRAMDRAPRLVRRTPSLFETRPVATDAGEETTVVEVTEPHPRPRPKAEEPPRIDEPSIEANATVAAAPVEDSARTMARTVAPASSPPVPDRTVLGPPASVGPASPAPIEIHHHETRVERTERHTIERRETVETPTVIERTTIVERMPEPAPAVPEAPRPDRTLVTPPPAVAVVREVSAPLRAAREPRVPVAARPQVRQPIVPTQHLHEPAPPSITVTIGRVEIRSIDTPRPPARPKRAIAPQVNLEEYLRRRSGGQS